MCSYDMRVVDCGSNDLGLHVSEFPVLYHRASTCSWMLNSLWYNLSVRGWLLSQADIAKNIQKGILSSYSSLIISNIEYSSQMSIHQSFVVFPDNWPPRNAMTKPSGCSSCLGLFPLHIVGPQCFCEASSLRNQSPARSYACSRVRVNRNMQEWRQKCIIQTHRSTHMNEETFYEKPTYLHASQSQVSVRPFSIFKPRDFFFLTNCPQNDNLLFIKGPLAQITSVLIPSELGNYTKYSTCP